MNNSPISSDKKEIKKHLDRFLRYVQTYSQSDSNLADNGILPSTGQQKDFAKKLENELKSIGIANTILTENYYVYAFIPSSKGFEKAPSVCLIAHMDTSEETSGKNVKPRIIEKYKGEIINYSGQNFVLNPDEDVYLAKAAKNLETIITSDVTTLL